MNRLMGPTRKREPPTTRSWTSERLSVGLFSETLEKNPISPDMNADAPLFSPIAVMQLRNVCANPCETKAASLGQDPPKMAVARVGCLEELLQTKISCLQFISRLWLLLSR